LAAKPRAVVIMLQKLTSMMPQAPMARGQMSSLCTDGIRIAGKPAGAGPTTMTPIRSSLSQ
jgi:hypothetical protein